MTRRLRSRHCVLTLSVLASLACWLGTLTYRSAKQEKLNHALFVAVEHNDTTGIRNLLRLGADPNATEERYDLSGRIWIALQTRFAPNPLPPHLVLFEAADEVVMPDDDNADTVRALLEGGADVNRRGDWNDTALIMSAERGKFATMRVLLAHHADVNAANRRGETALMRTAVHGNTQMVATLLREGATINASDNFGQTALHHVCTSPILTPAQRRETMAFLLQHGADVNRAENGGNTLLSLARDYKDKSLVQLLLQAGAR